MFALRIQQPNFYERPFYNVTLQDFHFILHPNGTREYLGENVDLERCTIDHWKNLGYGQNWENDFHANSFDEWLCLPIGFELKLGGTYTSPDFYFSQISISKCQNSTNRGRNWDPICATQQEIDDWSSGIYDTPRFTIYFSNYLINPDNPDNPIKKFLFNELFFNLSPGRLFRTSDIFFTETHLNTDLSVYPWENMETQKFPMFIPNDWREQYEAHIDYTTPATFYFRRSPYTYVFERKYEKLDEIISYIGGFIQALLVFAGFFIGQYNEFQYTIGLANKIYNFEFKDEYDDSDDNYEFDIDLKNQDEQGKNIEADINMDPEKQQGSRNNLISPNNQNQNQKLLDNLGNADRQQQRKVTIQPNRRRSTIHPSQVRAIIEQRQKMLQEQQQEKDDVGPPPNLSVIKEQDSIYYAPMIKDTPQSQPNIRSSKQVKELKGESKNKSQNISAKGQDKQPKKQQALDPILYEGLGFSSRKEFLTNEFEQILNRDTNVSLTFQFWLNHIFCGKIFKSEETLLIHKAKEMIRKDLDIHLMLDSIKQVEKLKKVIFDRDQNILFNFQPRPVIKIADDIAANPITLSQALEGKKNGEKLNLKQAGNLIHVTNIFRKGLLQQRQEDYKNISAFQKLYEGYENISNQILGDSKQDILQKKVNNRLIHLLGEEMKEIFETSKLIIFDDDKKIKRKFPHSPVRNAVENFKNTIRVKQKDTDFTKACEENENPPSKKSRSKSQSSRGSKKKLKNQSTTKSQDQTDSIIEKEGIENQSHLNHSNNDDQALDVPLEHGAFEKFDIQQKNQEQKISQSQMQKIDEDVQKEDQDD